MHADSLITAPDDAQKDLSIRQIDFDIQVAAVTGEIFFFYTDCGNEKRNACAAYVDGFAQDAGVASRFLSSFGFHIGVEPDFDRSRVTTTRSNHFLGPGTLEFGYQLANHFFLCLQ